MTLPKTGGAEWTSSQASPWATVNPSLRRLDANVSRAIIVDRDLAAPPGSCADGANYLVAASPTGAWAGQAGKMATAVGANASNGWYFQTVAVEGFILYLQDEDKDIIYDVGAWADYVPAGTPAPPAPTTQSGTAYTAVLADANGYILFTNAGAIAFTIPPNSSVAFPLGTTISLEQNGAGTVTLTPGAGVTLNSRGGLLLTAGQYAVVQLKKVGTDTWTIIGDVA